MDYCQGSWYKYFGKPWLGDLHLSKKGTVDSKGCYKWCACSCGIVYYIISFTGILVSILGYVKFFCKCYSLKRRIFVIFRVVCMWQASNSFFVGKGEVLQKVWSELFVEIASGKAVIWFTLKIPCSTNHCCYVTNNILGGQWFVLGVIQVSRNINLEDTYRPSFPSRFGSIFIPKVWHILIDIFSF